MRKIFLTTVLAWMAFAVHADEGMLLLTMLQGENMDQMQKMGLTLSANEIYSVNHASLKDAIVGLGKEGRPFRHFCSGEIISDKGLVATNYHCGFGLIQSHASLEHNYLANGFWAQKPTDELTCEGTTASILERMEDVTDRFDLPDTLTNRQAVIDSLSNLIEKEAVEGTHFSAQVIDMYEGNRFYLFVYTVYRDVRLVGAPPQSLGKFGGDTDNWSWPRHTCDFSMLRIYTAPDGSPAAYAPENIPLKPKHVLPVSAKGIKEGDFTMVMGFPGSTDRFATSFSVDNTMQIENTIRYHVRSKILDIMDEGMANDESVRLQYASKRATCSNYWKYSYEQNKALQKLGTIRQKQTQEAQFAAWVAADSARSAQYGTVLQDLERYYAGIQETEFSINFLNEALASGMTSHLFAVRIEPYIEALTQKDISAEKKDSIQNQLREAGNAFFKDFNAGIEQKLYAEMLRSFIMNNADYSELPIFQLIKKKYKSDFPKFAEELVSTSFFTDKNRFMAFIENPNFKKYNKDLAYQTGNNVKGIFMHIASTYENDSLDFYKRLYVRGLMEMNADKTYCPDANSTLRLSYGQVKSYQPRDAVHYDYYTTLEGVMEKEDTNNPEEFTVSDRLKELYKTHDFHPYGGKQLNVNFLTTNDITGGNSGSPVINGRGELVGLAFDGNSEAMSGDIDFEENLQRCIALDTRYMLYIIDKYADAQYILDEINIVK